jgi:phenylacetate-coenzyme A ligase PaaK-like adenylate-forming protein
MTAHNRPLLDDWIARKIGLASGQLPTRGDIEAYQLSALNQTLRHACQNSVFYKARFGGVHLQSLSDLTALPFTTPEDLRKNALGMLCVSPGLISRIVTLYTSGSTGAAKRVYFSEEDQELCVDFFHHGMRCLVDHSDTVGILFPARSPGSVGDLLQKGLSRIGCRSVTLYERSQDPAALHELLKSEKITSLAGFPLLMMKLAETGIALGRTGGPEIRSVLISADYVSDTCRALIKNAWNPRIYEHYGMTEMGLGCAVSCSGQLSRLDVLGYHVRENDLYLEIVDPVTGEPCKTGESGEIVFTTLTRHGMPFIRYRTGDISRWQKSACSCGSVLRLLGRVGDRGIKKGNPV